MTIYRFGDIELDTSLYELRREREPVEIGPRAFDVLAYLIRYRDRLVSRDELIREVWGVTVMSVSSVPTCIAVVRKVLGDDLARPQYIETVRGRGYRFIAPLTQPTPECGSDGSPAPTEVAAQRDLQRAGFAGEPGIGKLRTIDEFTFWARGDGAVVLIGRCLEGAPAFWVFAQVARSHVDASDSGTALWAAGARVPSLPGMTPELAERHPELPPPPPLDAGQARCRLFEAVSALLGNAALEQPLAGGQAPIPEPERPQPSVS